VAGAVESVTDSLGYDPTLQPEAEEEVTRQADLGRMRSLAGEYTQAHPDGDPAGFLGELADRFAVERTGRGVNLLTFHRSKGLEFDAVFLPRLLAGELPFKRGRTEADLDEERRLLYVGITRARTWLYLSWPREAKTVPSPFLRELGLTPATAAARPARRSAAGSAEAVGGPLFDRLRDWRKRRATTDGVPAYVIFHDKTLAEIATTRPKDWADLSAISGVGERKLDLYADDVLEIVARG
jgi:DNA helicase II / ATP-dependent DNA helicase PcrA